MLDLLPPAWDEWISRRLCPLSRWASRQMGGPDLPLSSQATGLAAWVIGRKHCEGSRECWK